MYFGRRLTSGRRLLDPQEHAVVVEPISIVDDIAEDEEEAYEEMDEEEDDDCPTSSVTVPMMPCTEVEAPGRYIME
ncbi:unnamed protein product [Cylicostephanus goldi]|uniref:Uncharacterized protein n=1 Tax=Cylicostephanus goldi TaxID=71465 RepID=A0A3P7MUD7_CYLGO|nr:unnamed protein product [Cylicostephanus goldi]